MAALGGDLVENGLSVVVVNDAVSFDHSVDGESGAAFALAIFAVAAVHDERLGDHPVTEILADAATFERIWRGVRRVSPSSRQGLCCCWARGHNGGLLLPAQKVVEIMPIVLVVSGQWYWKSLEWQ